MPSYQRWARFRPSATRSSASPTAGSTPRNSSARRASAAVYSLLYHQYPPTRVSKIERFGAACAGGVDAGDAPPPSSEDGTTCSRAATLSAGARLLMYNADCAISVVAPTEPMDYFYRNAMGDELLFVHHGSGHAGDDLRHAALP